MKVVLSNLDVVDYEIGELQDKVDYLTNLIYEKEDLKKEYLERIENLINLKESLL